MKAYYSIESIEKIVCAEQVKVVSFDLFDTLLIRPSMNPTDIFYLLKNEVESKYGLDFIGLRLHAEEEMKRDDAALSDIWNWIAQKNNLNLEISNALMKMELALEASLLTVREEILTIVRKAKQAGKRIIVTSDMYINGKELLRILNQKGINEIDALYVSCDCHARKSTGRLYEFVMKEEKIGNPSQIVHIGDNFQSDYQAALEKGITAIYYPSIWDDILGKKQPWEGAMGRDATQDPYARLMLSYAIFYTYLYNKRKLGEKRCFSNVKEIASLYLGNILVAISLDLLNNQEIRAQYDKISFAARDGYLPKRIYDILATNHGLPSNYFQASRQALSYTTYKDFFDYFANIPWKTVYLPYTLENYIRYYIIDVSLQEKILSSLKLEERNIDLSKSALKAYGILKRYKKELNDYFYLQANLAREYYENQFPDSSKRYLVFDCGYSGSVSQGLMGINPNSKRIFDKYYIWQTSSNRKKDEKAGTKTYCLTPSENYIGINLILEECFSPLEGSCVGFWRQEKNIIAIHETFLPNEDMKLTMHTLHSSCETYAVEFKKMFGPYLDCFMLTDRDIFTRIGLRGFLESPYMELSLLKPICFSDSLNGGVPISLSKKVYDVFEMMGKYPTVFHGTQFRNPVASIRPYRYIETKLKIGIHLHLHYLYVIEEFIGYMKDFPARFDLIITTTKSQSCGALEQLCTSLLPCLNKIKVIAVENRGRDVAPWLVTTKPFQENYDIFCHLHGKASAEYDEGVGDAWRKYLFDNLIERQAVTDIIELFEENKRLGCLFPQYYEYISQICISNRIPLVGEFNEKKIIEQLMQAMHINRLFSRDDMIYSCGTMMWYRPNALKPLFEIGLTMDDFPKEPIANGGTIAHAIERMPGMVCASQGYQTAIYNHTSNSMKDGNPYMPYPMKISNREYVKSLRGHKPKWYLKKTVKAIAPYGVIRIWQRIRYKF